MAVGPRVAPPCLEPGVSPGYPLTKLVVKPTAMAL